MSENVSIIWEAWSAETFEKAEREEKAVLVYLRHAGCDWCLQMEEESFGDAEIVRCIGESFVPVRVESHVRPDIGRYCHALFTRMTGREANDPLVLFLSGEQVPLYVASYMPDRERDGMMGLYETLALVAQKYATQKELLLSKGREVLASMESGRGEVEATRLNSTVGALAAEQIKSLYDAAHGGFGGRPKFPRYSVLQLGMDIYESTEDAALRAILSKTVNAMTEGGLRDSRDGGYFRYCTDAAWEQPAKGKVLYDTALMVGLLLRASVVLEEERYRVRALQATAFLQERMSQEGLFGTLYDAGMLKERRVIVSWNAMAVKSLFLAGVQERAFRQLAVASLGKLLEHGMVQGQLFHSFTPGALPEDEAFLEDYAYLSDVLLEAHIQTEEAHYLIKASELINEALKRFFNGGMWRFDSGRFQIPDEPGDRAYPSATAIMAGVLQKAAERIDPAYEKFFRRTLEVHSYALMREPISLPQLSRVLLRSV